MPQDIVEVKGIDQLTNTDVRKFFCEKANDKEIVMFLSICKMANLNPFLREAYLVKIKDTEPASILTGYEVYLRRAESSGQYAGFRVWIEGVVPDMIACIKVYRKDWKEPLEHSVKYKEYVQNKYDEKTRQYVPNRIWNAKPETMLKKVAISQGLRWAFPQEIAGLPYIMEEAGEREEHEENEVQHSKPTNVKEPIAKSQVSKAETKNPPISAEQYGAEDADWSEKEQPKESSSAKPVEFLTAEQVEVIDRVAAKVFNKSKKTFSNWLWKKFDVSELNKITAMQYNQVLEALQEYEKEKAAIT